MLRRSWALKQQHRHRHVPQLLTATATYLSCPAALNYAKTTAKRNIFFVCLRHLSDDGAPTSRNILSFHLLSGKSMNQLLGVALMLSVASAQLSGAWSCHQAVVSSSGSGTPSPFTMNIAGTSGKFYDRLACSGGCSFFANFSFSGYAMTGYYYTGATTGSPHGVWSIAVNASRSILGLTTSFASGSSYLIQCTGSSRAHARQASLGNQLSGLWDGTEGRVGYHGITATSYIAMTVNGSTGIFTDNFGCPGGCRIDSAFGYFFNGSLGYYHDRTRTYPARRLCLPPVLSRGIRTS